MRRGDCICEWSRGTKRGMYIIFFCLGQTGLGALRFAMELPLFFVIWLSEYRICIWFWFSVWDFLLQLSCSL